MTALVLLTVIMIAVALVMMLYNMEDGWIAAWVFTMGLAMAVTVIETSCSVAINDNCFLFS